MSWTLKNLVMENIKNTKKHQHKKTRTGPPFGKSIWQTAQSKLGDIVGCIEYLDELWDKGLPFPSFKSFK